jgi:tripartite-type tricarboxylate transporter receptor subunit TctC
MTARMRYLSGSLAAAVLAASAAYADSYPSRGLTYIVPFDAGGQTDIASRVFADALADALGVSVSVVNRGGAGGSVGTAEIAAARSDGYTVGITTTSPMIQAPNRTNTPYDLDSFTFICRVYSNPMIMVVKDGSALDSVPAMIEATKGGRRLTYGSVGTGSVQHVAMVQLMEQAGFEAVQVQSTSDADNVRNLLADVVDTYWVAGSVYRQNAELLRPLAIMAQERLEMLPDVPTIYEIGYDVPSGVWGAFVAPAGLGEAETEALRAACRTAQESESFIDTLTGFGMEPVYLDGHDTEMLARDQFATAGRILAELGLVDK